MSEQRCPTCGSVVKVAGDPVEGTMYYEPHPEPELSLSLAREQRLRDRLNAVEKYARKCARLRMEPSTRGLREALSSVPAGEGQ